MISRRSVFIAGAGAALIGSTARSQTSTSNNVEEFLPQPNEQLAKPERDQGDVTSSFSVESQGHGTFTGLAYTVSPHTRGRILAEIKTLAITSADVENLNNLIRGMLSATQYERVRDYERTHASANISYWGFWSGGGSASYEKIHETIRGFGLSEENIKTIVNAMSEIAKKMSTVKLDYDVDNTKNNYSVSGSLMVYTIAGSIKSQNTQNEFRFLADKGVAGSNRRTAPATGKIIPLS